MFKEISVSVVLLVLCVSPKLDIGLLGLCLKGVCVCTVCACVHDVGLTVLVSCSVKRVCYIQAPLCWLDYGLMLATLQNPHCFLAVTSRAGKKM